MNHQLHGSNISDPHFYNQDGMRVVFQPGQFPQTGKPIKLNKNAFIGIGITQMLIGVTCFILNIVQIAKHPSGFGSTAYGIWGGTFFFISGLLSLLIGKTSTNRCLIVSTMVMNIISACVAIAVLACGIFFTLFQGYRGWFNPYDYGIGATIAALAAIEEIISITCSALCCKAYCCCCSQADNVVIVHGYPGNVSYSNNSGFQAPVMFYQPPLVSQQPLSSQNNGFQMNYPPPYNSKEKP